MTYSSSKKSLSLVGFGQARSPGPSGTSVTQLDGPYLAGGIVRRIGSFFRFMHNSLVESKMRRVQRELALRGVEYHTLKARSGTAGRT